MARTSRETYRKAYRRLVDNKNSKVVNEDGTLKMTFEEYEAYAINRVERHMNHLRSRR